MLEHPTVISRRRVAQLGDALLFGQTVNGEERFFLFFSIQRDGAPGRTRTCGILLRSYAVQNSKCRFWCRLRGSASFISPLNWTEVGLQQPEAEAHASGVE